MKRFDFNDGWLFSKEGGATRTLDLPHDAMIEEDRAQGNPSGSACAYFAGGKYIYEKSFTISAESADTNIMFEFEGVYKNSKVFINNKEVGGCAYGYTTFFVNTDGVLNYGGENKMRVIADNSDTPNSRWYTGSGIYRPVWMWQGNKTHILPQGVKISTLSYSPARIKVDVEHVGGEVDLEISYKGKIVATGKGDSVELDITNAKLWSDETPELYECHVSLTEAGVVMDEVIETFGIRIVEWSPKGLFINGKETLLRGGCVHHDNGILGARCYAKSEERRVRIMKEGGFNAIRVSHNPSSKAMLEACDKLGLYVMDETWDMWFNKKSRYDYANDFMENYKFDIEAMVNRDFNHPSVIMYSIGNEISEPATDKGINIAKEMIAFVHELDSNRAVTAGINPMIINMASKGKGVYKEEGGRDNEDKELPNSSTLFNMITTMVGTGMNKSGNSKSADRAISPVVDALDIVGYNYANGRYPLDGKHHPNRVIVGAETFPQDLGKNWGMVKKYPYLVGDFMWTSWDYLGEVGLGAWAYTPDGKKFNKPYPWLLAECGVFDILGNENAEAGYTAVVWGQRTEPYIGVQPVNHPGVKPAKAVWRGTNALPSWAWKDCEGNKAIVEVYVDAAKVELLLNGKSLGTKKVKNYKATFKTKYVSGTLIAVSYDISGRETGRTELTSATGKTTIRVMPEENTINAGEIVYVPIDLVGENNIIESNNDVKLTVTVDGGELLAFGSANPRTPEDYNSGSFTTYYGRSLAVVRCKIAGKAIVSVSGQGLDSASAEISVV